MPVTEKYTSKLGSGQSKSVGSANSQQAFGVAYVDEDSIPNIDSADDSDFQLMSAYNDNAPFIQFEIFPHRGRQSKLLYTWHAHECTDFNKIVYIRRFLTKGNPSNLKPSSTATMDDISPFTNLTYADVKTITNSATEGDVYEEYVEDGYYVVVVIAWFYTTDTDQFHYTWHWSLDPVSSCEVTSAPSLTYNADTGNFSIGKSMTGRRILEFYNTSHTIGYPTSIHSTDTLSQMYLSSMIDTESHTYKGYYTAAEKCLQRWTPGNYTIGAFFSKTATQNKSIISRAINNAIDEVNAVMNTFGVYFSRNDSASSPSIQIIIGSEYALFDISSDSDEVIGGDWEIDGLDNNIITSATIRLADDYYDIQPYVPYEVVTLEELLQCMGAGFDQFEYCAGTIHTEFNYYNKYTSIPQRDKDILKLIYSDYVSAGDNCTKVALALNLPNGIYQATSTADNVTVTTSHSFLGSGTYKVRAFIVNSNGEISESSDWVTVEGTRPANWNWHIKNVSADAGDTYKAFEAISYKGKLTDFSYTVWNDLIEKTKEFMKYKGIITDTIGSAMYGYPQGSKLSVMIEGAKMSDSDKVMTAKRFNIVRFCIGSMEATGMHDFSTGDIIKGEYFKTLTDSLNRIT